MNNDGFLMAIILIVVVVNVYCAGNDSLYCLYTRNMVLVLWVLVLINALYYVGK
jgi:hypothetical protein